MQGIVRIAGLASAFVIVLSACAPSGGSAGGASAGSAGTGATAPAAGAAPAGETFVIQTGAPVDRSPLQGCLGAIRQTNDASYESGPTPYSGVTVGRRFANDLLPPATRQQFDAILNQARSAHIDGQEAQCYGLVNQARQLVGLPTV